MPIGESGVVWARDTSYGLGDQPAYESSSERNMHTPLHPAAIASSTQPKLKCLFLTCHLINCFEQAWARLSMNLHNGAYYLCPNLILIHLGVFAWRDTRFFVERNFTTSSPAPQLRISPLKSIES